MGKENKYIQVDMNSNFTLATGTLANLMVKALSNIQTAKVTKENFSTDNLKDKAH